MKSVVLFSGIPLGIPLSYQKETQYRNISFQDITITPDTKLKHTLEILNIFTSDSGVYPEDSTVIKVKK
ncbi:MAG: hypothetical protein P0Y62_02815 [Candidatus Chryseobacterium colombiense]|nr:hypothetical protein [Chryseobacterium sp.]WEK70488.1 MAG: hypothetical protein P0Y62_02815 [Chryseobacterium sp.]